MLNETIGEFLTAYLSSADAKRLSALLKRLFGPGILKQRTASELGRRIKTAVRDTFEQGPHVEGITDDLEPRDTTKEVQP